MLQERDSLCPGGVPHCAEWSPCLRQVRGLRPHDGAGVRRSSWAPGSHTLASPERARFPWRLSGDLCVFAPPGADLTLAEASSSDSRGDRAELYGHVDEGLLGGEASFLGPPLTPEKDEVLHQATAVANLRAALMSKNSLLSLKADVLGDDSSLLLEYLPKGAHSLSRKCCAPCAGAGGREVVGRGACPSGDGDGGRTGLGSRGRPRGREGG